MDYEKSVLSKLRKECGYTFISNMERMVSRPCLSLFLEYNAKSCLSLSQVEDMILARENQTKFEEYLNHHSDMNLGIDMTVMALDNFL